MVCFGGNYSLVFKECGKRQGSQNARENVSEAQGPGRLGMERVEEWKEAMWGDSLVSPSRASYWTLLNAVEAPRTGQT